MRRPLGYFVENTDRLRKIILEHPDYPIVVQVDHDVVADDEYAWWLAPCISFSIQEILDCHIDNLLGLELDDLNVFFDRDEFKDYIENVMDCSRFDELPDEEFNRVLNEEFHKFDDYWVPAIVIRAEV